MIFLQALIYQLVSGLTDENGKYNYAKAVHPYPPFFDISCSAKNYKIASALTVPMMEQTEFIKRLVDLRMAKGVSARDMSLSIGQSAGYINNIENGINYPWATSWIMVFKVCV